MTKTVFKFETADTIKKENSSLKRGMTTIKKVISDPSTEKLLSGNDLKILQVAQDILDDLLFKRESEQKDKLHEEKKAEREKKRKAKIISDLAKNETLEFKVQAIKAKYKYTSIWDVDDAEKHFVDCISDMCKSDSTREEIVTLIEEVKKKINSRESDTSNFDFIEFDDLVKKTLSEIAQNEK